MTATSLSYLIYGKTGYGHAARLVAILRALQDKRNFPLDVYANTAVWPVIQAVANLPRLRIKPYDYVFHDDPENPGGFSNDKERVAFFTSNHECLEDWRQSIIFTDFVKHSIYIKEAFGNALLGLTHSDLVIRPSDTDEVVAWKDFIRKTVDMCDVVFQSTVLPEEQSIRNVIPVPIIARKPTRGVQEVKRFLGLSPDEQFILYYPGVERGPKRYPHLDDLLAALAELRLPLRIVVMHGIDAQRRELNTDKNGCIHIYNEQEGQDFVRAAAYVLAKPGMSLFSECLAAQTPILLCRAMTGETLVRERMYADIIGIEPPILKDFDAHSLSLAIDALVEQSQAIRRAFQKVRTDGDQVVANLLVHAVNHLSSTGNSARLLDYLLNLAFV